MREIIRERIGEEEACSYLEGRRSRMRYRFIEHCGASTYERMLERGWRRFGTIFFRPVCQGCDECRSLRIEIESFRLSRSQRRVRRANGDLRVVLRPPSMSAEHLELYDRYHAAQSRRKGWPERRAEPFDYHMSFVAGHESFGHELLFFIEERLVMVSLVDVLPRALSAVYCYYDPDLGQRGLGVFSVLCQVELARRRGVAHLYLGYWVEDCPSMSYKARYLPHQILAGRPEWNERPRWRSAQAPRRPHAPT